MKAAKSHFRSISTHLFADVQTYITGIIFLYAIIAFVPQIQNEFYLPKLLILSYGCILISIIKFIRECNNPTKAISITFIEILVGFFLISNLISTIFSKAPVISFFGFYTHEGLNSYFLVIVSYVFFTMNKLSLRHKQIILGFINVGIVTSALYTIAVYITRIGILPTRPIGTEGHPIWSAGVMGFGIFFIFLQQFPKSLGLWVRRSVIALVILINGVALWLLQSNTVWLSIAAGFAGTCIMFGIHSRISNIRKTILFILIAIFCSIILILAIKNESFSLSKRMSELTAATKMIKNELLSKKSIRRTLFGYGQNMSGFSLSKYKNQLSVLDKEWFYNVTNIHQQFVEFLFTIGVVGLIIWIVKSIRGISLAFMAKNFFLLALLQYAFFLQQLYFLLPMQLLLLFFAFGLCVDRKTYMIIFKKLRLKHSVIVGAYGLLILVSIVSALYISRYFFADFSYKKQDFISAKNTIPYNDEYNRAYINSINIYLNNCYKKLVTEECSQAKITSLIRLAETSIDNILAINPYNTTNLHTVSNFYFLSYIDTNRMNKSYFRNSLYYASKSLSIDPVDPAMLNDTGLIYLENGDMLHALQFFKKSFIIKNDEMATINHLIDIYQKLGDKDNVRIYNNALLKLKNK